MPFAPVGTPAPPSRALPRMAIALLACLALYGIDLACMATVPATGFDFASGFAVPFDLMVFVPAVFYLLVVRRYRLSPLLVLPVIWLGGLVSLQFAAPGKPSLLAPLGPVRRRSGAGHRRARGPPPRPPLPHGESILGQPARLVLGRVFRSRSQRAGRAHGGARMRHVVLRVGFVAPRAAHAARLPGVLVPPAKRLRRRGRRHAGSHRRRDGRPRTCWQHGSASRPHAC